jgi:hypothetical protein
MVEMEKKQSWRDRPRIEAPLVPSTPQIGSFTRKMTNSLLIKPELGSVKQTTYTLPGRQHTYGKALYREDEGTGEMIMSWMEHMPNPHAKPGRDFKALNKGAVVAGATTAKAQIAYRKSHDVRLRLGTHEDRRFTLADGFIHGKATRYVHPSLARARSISPRIPRIARRDRSLTRAAQTRWPHTLDRPSTPMNDLISSAYRWSWVAEHMELGQGLPAPEKKPTRPATTKASRGHASVANLRSASPPMPKEVSPALLLLLVPRLRTLSPRTAIQSARRSLTYRATLPIRARCAASRSRLCSSASRTSRPR